MAMAIVPSDLNVPKSLYSLSINCFVLNLNTNVKRLDEVNCIKLFPATIAADIYETIADIHIDNVKKTRIENILLNELSNVKSFIKLLNHGFAKKKLYKCFAYLESKHQPIANEIAKNYYTYVKNNYLDDNIEDNNNNNNNNNKKNNNANNNKKKNKNKNNNKSNNINNEDIVNKHSINMFTDHEMGNGMNEEHLILTSYFKTISTGLRIGTFLTDAGWIEQSIKVLSTTLNILCKNRSENYQMTIFRMECLQRLLRAQAEFCSFKDAEDTIFQGHALIREYGEDYLPSNLIINWYRDLSVLNYCKSEFSASYSWILKAMKLTTKHTPHSITVDVLRQTGRTCTMKRQFKKAYMLMQHACELALKEFGENHEKYADALLDYGNFLLNVDSIPDSVNTYRTSLTIKQAIFGQRNFRLAIQHEDLAYALYVREYNSGNFDKAHEHISRAIEILSSLVPANSLMLASARRVKALILEEIALDNLSSMDELHGLLLESEKLHTSALELSLEAFGEVNVQTAKHYGNLGRLYQSMMKYRESEEMHKRAIQIKTDILGPYDFEVGLSVGHLASLYNYHMDKHRDAEKLYLQSINISLKLFGESYSGLEYDYRGLCHVYESLGEPDKFIEYAQTLTAWRILREENAGRNRQHYSRGIEKNQSLESLTKQFFDMCVVEPILY